MYSNTSRYTNHDEDGRKEEKRRKKEINRDLSVNAKKKKERLEENFRIACVVMKLAFHEKRNEMNETLYNSY